MQLNGSAVIFLCLTLNLFEKVCVVSSIADGAQSKQQQAEMAITVLVTENGWRHQTGISV
jgi:hypothetical protein